jgi:hypothetical protein
MRPALSLVAFLVRDLGGGRDDTSSPHDDERLVREFIDDRLAPHTGRSRLSRQPIGRRRLWTMTRPRPALRLPSMYGEAGEFFFHYTTADTAFRHIVADGGRLRLSPYSQMRDPVEAEDWTFVGTYVGDELPNDEALSRHFAFHEYARRAKATTKLLSLTVDADGYEDSLADFARGYARATMWELYADRHAGVCLVFDRPKLADVLDEQLSGQGTCFTVLCATSRAASLYITVEFTSNR